MKTTHDPRWWRPEYDEAWERVRGEFSREFNPGEDDFDDADTETARDVMATEGPADGALVGMERRASGHDESEEACRFGYGAHMHYAKKYQRWDPEVEAMLQQEWFDEHPEDEEAWNDYRDSMRRGWDYYKN